MHDRPPIPGQPRADRLVVSISDLELGAGGPFDDVPSASFVSQVIRSYSDEPFRHLAVDLVLNGDTFDLLKTSVDGRYPIHIDAEVAVRKLERVLAAHPDFLDALKAFLAAPTDRRVFFVVGNHDQELLFPEVQQLLRERLSDHPGVYLPGFSIGIGDALVEHGSQGDNMFRVPPEAPFVSFQGRRLLNLPWATVALIEAMMPLQTHLFWADRLKPRKLVFEHLPELREVLVDAFWNYWTRDYWRDLFGGDPLKQASWTMVREVAYRFGSLDPDVPFGQFYKDRIRKDDRWRVRTIGHHHRPTWWSYCDRKLLITGCYRNEFMVLADGTVGNQLPKVHAEIYQHRGRTVRSHLVELDGPPVPEGFVPKTLAEMRPSLRALLKPEAERTAVLDAQSHQEAAEALGDGPESADEDPPS